MADEERISENYDDMEPLKTQGGADKYLPKEYPPPPGDWVSHPITRLILALILLGFVGVLIWKWDAWLEYVRTYPYGMGLAAFVVIVLIFLIGFSYWRFRAVGEAGITYWSTDKKKKKPR